MSLLNYKGVQQRHLVAQNCNNTKATQLPARTWLRSDKCHVTAAAAVKRPGINSNYQNKEGVSFGNSFFTSFSILTGLFREHHGASVIIPPKELPWRLPYNKRARDGKYIEQLGTYDPLPNIYNEKLVSFNFDRIKYWMGCGAHPTKPVSKLLGLAGFFPLHPMTITEAERRIAAQPKETETEESMEEGQKQPEV
ncbi:hypothetical protein LDENG_00258460 [Lucifuga dentata]|nr:hypothetical protein LDENG_00258460 [Lucifuga dentata]